MKVFFNAPIRGRKHFDKEYQQIYEIITELGYIHLYELLHKVTEKELYNDLEKGGYKAYDQLYEETINKIKQADINIFECSLPSLGVGFQIEKSLEFNKPTIVLYKDDNIPHFFAGTHDDKFILKQYTAKNLKKVIQGVFNEAKLRADKRFNFFISPKLLSYLENESKRQSVTKSNFIRSLILAHMKRNTES